MKADRKLYWVLNIAFWPSLVINPKGLGLPRPNPFHHLIAPLPPGKMLRRQKGHHLPDNRPPTFRREGSPTGRCSGYQLFFRAATGWRSLFGSGVPEKQNRRGQLQPLVQVVSDVCPVSSRLLDRSKDVYLPARVLCALNGQRQRCVVGFFPTAKKPGNVARSELSAQRNLGASHAVQSLEVVECMHAVSSFLDLNQCREVLSHDT